MKTSLTLKSALFFASILSGMYSKSQNTSPLPPGNVGIGTTSPQYPLHVIGTIKTDRLHFTYGSYLNLGNTDGPGRFRLSHQDGNQADMIFQTSADSGKTWANGLTLNSSGNVTIPGNIVVGTPIQTPLRGTIVIGAPDVSVNSALAIRQSNNVNFGFDFALSQQGSCNLNLQMIQANAVAKNVMSFDRNTGNVGFGVAPSTAMHLATTGNSGDDGWFQIQRLTANANSAGLLLTPAGAITSTNKQWGVGLYPNSSDFTIWNSTNTILTASATSGYVGIGTTKPTQMLSVKGTVLATKVRVSLPTATPANPDWPDYVFKQQYRLRSLPELKSYIKKHDHLPDMPSAREVKKEGLDLAETQAALLKKIEELTLYVLDQDEKIKHLQSEVTVLQSYRK